MKTSMVLLAIGFVFSAASAEASPLTCQDLLKNKILSDADILSVIDLGQSRHGGERNANLLKFYESNIAAISPSGAVTLIRALVPEGPLPIESQFSAHVPQKYAREKMVQLYLERNKDVLSESDVAYFEDLLDTLNRQSR